MSDVSGIKFYQKNPIGYQMGIYDVYRSDQLADIPIPDLKDAGEFLSIMFGTVHFESLNFTYPYYFTVKMIVLMLIGIVGAVFLQGRYVERLQCKIRRSKILYSVQEVVLLGLMVTAVIFVVSSTYSPFIYFQY